MDRLVGARKLLAELVKTEELEVRRLEIVGRDLAQLIESRGHPPSGAELADWLDEHPQVTEIYAGPSVLDELVERYLTPVVERIEVEARHPELEQQLRDADGPAPYLVYADWLQTQSDPMGELIAHGVAATEGSEDAIARFERYLKLHEARFLGGLAHQLTDRIVLRWRYGLVHALEEGVRWQMPSVPSARMWDELLRLRVCELVDSITFHRSIDAELDDVLAAAAPPWVRSVAIEVSAGQLPTKLLQRPLRSLSLRADALTIGPDTLPSSLERLELRARQIDASTPSLPNLRELEVGLNPSVAAALAGLGLPRLERLTIGMGYPEGANPADLLEQMALPALTHLAISDGAVETKVITKLAKLPIAARLSSLALINLGLTDDRIRLIAETRAFQSLTELDVSFNELTREGLASARELAPNVISRRQHKLGSAMDKRIRMFAGSRLQAAEDIADPKLWSRAGIDGDVRWARYRGDSEYELFVSTDLRRYACSCPSSIQPCKHVVALALVGERTQLPEAPSEGIEERVSRDQLDNWRND